MQTNFRKQDDDVLRDLIKYRNRIAEDIGDLLSLRDSIDCDLAELRKRLQELNDDIDLTKHENIKDAKKQEDEFTKILNSGDYSTLDREYRRLNREIYEGRKCDWHVDGNNYSLEGEIRMQRRDIGDKMLKAEKKEFELNGKQQN
jgi:hypothetical protein